MLGPRERGVMGPPPNPTLNSLRHNVRPEIERNYVPDMGKMPLCSTVRPLPNVSPKHPLADRPHRRRCRSIHVEEWSYSSRHSAAFMHLRSHFQRRRIHVSWKVHNMAAILTRHFNQFVRFPDEESSRQIKEAFHNRYRFPSVVIAIDCIHIGIRATVAREDVYVNRK